MPTQNPTLSIDDARRLLRSGKATDAEAAFGTIFETRTTGWAEAGLALAGIHHRSGDGERARQVLQVLCDEAPDGSVRGTAKRIFDQLAR